jgi:hypothetical protein
MKSKTLAWWDSNNFGDALNPYLFWSFGVKVSYEQANTANVIALGSVIERIFVGAHTKNETHFSASAIDVWGSGVHFEVGKHIEQPNIELPEKFIRTPKIHAVRGKISKSRVEKVLGTPLPNNLALGDPGLLMNRIIKPSKQKKYDLGIIAHFHDASLPVFKAIQKNIKNSIIIDVKSDPYSFIKIMTQCRAIISTAMHPIIVADSYQIPNLWITTGNDKISSYKWDDYYSVFDKDKAPVFTLNEKTFNQEDLNELMSSYSINENKLVAIQNDLIGAFPYSSNLKYLTHIDILKLRWRTIKQEYKYASAFKKLMGLIKIYLMPLKP